MGRDQRSVKPSAQPTLVRTQHLPPPAKTARDRGILPSHGLSCVVSSCVMIGHDTPLRGSGYGHMADGFRPEQAVQRTACSGIFDGPRSLVKKLARTRGAVTGGRPGLAHACPARSAGSRENPADIGVSSVNGREPVPPGSARFPCAITPGSRPDGAVGGGQGPVRSPHSS